MEALRFRLENGQDLNLYRVFEDMTVRSWADQLTRNWIV